MYCTYLTFYSGNRLPPFYLGSTSIARIEKGYCGSVVSNRYSKTSKEELRQNPHLFRTKILSWHDTNNEAKQRELKWQHMLHVVSNPLYINQGIFPFIFAESRKGKTFEQIFGDQAEEIIEKRRKKIKGRPSWNKGKPYYETHSPEGIARMIASKKGKKHPCSEATRKKISAVKKGHSNGRKGINHSETTKQKMRKAALGRVPWNKGKPMKPKQPKIYKDEIYRYHNGCEAYNNKTGIHGLSKRETKKNSHKGNNAFNTKMINPAYRELHGMKITYGRLKKRFDALLTAQTYFVDFTP
jgi:hypothetical protein